MAHKEGETVPLYGVEQRNDWKVHERNAKSVKKKTWKNEMKKSEAYLSA